MNEETKAKRDALDREAVALFSVRTAHQKEIRAIEKRIAEIDAELANLRKAADTLPATAENLNR